MKESFLMQWCITVCVWLQGLNWDDLAKKKIPAPFKPMIRDPMDVSNFSDDFTSMPPTESPAVVPDMGNKLFKVSQGTNRLRD
jgi:ribosomal protein S6 kinase alpha-5